jgi:hypothetical protein
VLSTPITITTREYYLGVDFGTRYSKVALWSEGSERRIWRDPQQGNLIPSVVYVAPSGEVAYYDSNPLAGAQKIEYLKMIVAGDSGGVFGSVRPTVNGLDIATIAPPLAAAFLANIIRKAMRSEEKRLRGVPVRWLVNLGMPVQYCDAPEKAIFEKIGAIAFEWSRHPRQSETVETLCEGFWKAERELDLAYSSVTVVPELTAALHDFFRDSNRAEGLYAFCDVGGGTLDAAVFRINRTHGIIPIGVPSARVEQLGTRALSEGLRDQLALSVEDVEQVLIQSDYSSSLAKSEFLTDKERVQNFLRAVVNDARMKEQAHTFYEEGDARRPKKDLPLFMAGGGAGSWWYQTALKETDGTAFDGLTGAKPRTVPKPQHFRGDDFPRFVVALGLADAPENFSDAVLPGNIPRKTGLPPRPVTPPLYDGR